MTPRAFHFWLWTYVFLAIAILFCIREAMLLPDGKVHAYFLDVGQGDSAFIVSPSGKQIVIDGGPNLSLLADLSHLMPFFDRSIDLLVLSHPHLDHLASFPELLKRYKVGAVLMTGMKYGTGQYKEMLSEIAEEKIPVILPNPTKDIDLGDELTLDVIWPKDNWLGRQGNANDANNTSVVLRALYHGHSIFFAGDMEEPEERAVLASGADVESEILKVAHHGSRTSSSTGFILAVHPHRAIVSVGAGNTYGLPDEDVLDRYAHFGIPVQQTMTDGTISVVME